MANPCHLASLFGLLGNILSFLFYLAPVPMFARIIKKKSAQGFQSVPYSVALFSAMSMLCYAFQKPDGYLLIAINAIGVVIESIYMMFSPTDAKICAAKLLGFFNFGAYCLIMLFSFFCLEGSLRTNIVGWICAIFSVCVFAAPLSIIRLVIQTKSVEYMPFWLSFSLTLCAIVWFFYGVCIDDYYIAAPNVLGFTFGVVQMMIYVIYKRKRNVILPKTKPQEAQPQPQRFQIATLFAAQETLNGNATVVVSAGESGV